MQIECGAQSDVVRASQAIEELDLSPIKFKLMHKHGESWSRDYTDEVERWYRRYLLLSFKYPKQSIVVTKPIDTFWHYHILDTQKYAKDCQKVFGYFLHHFPYFGMRGDDDERDLQVAFENSLRLIEEEFGESLMDASISKPGARKPMGGGEVAFWGASCSDCSGSKEGSDGSDDGNNREDHRPRLI